MARFCRQCGNPVNDGAKFCRSCGAAIPERPAAPAYAPARTAARPRTTSSRVGAPVKEPKKKKHGAGVVAAILVAALLVTGFGWPGWLRGHKPEGPDYRMDGDVMELTIPALSKAQEEVYQAGSSATQAYYTARLCLARLTKAAQNGVGGAELEALADQTAEAWRIADKISRDTEQMARALEKTESAAKAKAGSVLSGLDLSVRAHAAGGIDPKLLEWAQEITDMYDKAPAGRQVRTLAEQLGTDAKHAFEIVKQSQAIMKGKYEGDADVANYWYETCMKTKTACKAIVVTTAVVTSGGAAGAVGALDGALLTCSGIDAIVEVGDTTLNIVAGEDSRVYADYQEMKDKIAPVTGVAGAAGLFLGSWATNLDKAGQLIYISDSAHDLMENNKLMGIQLPGTGPAPGETGEKTIKLVKLPAGEGDPPEEVKETLEKIGIPPEEAEKIAEAMTEKPQDAPPSGEEASIGGLTGLDGLSGEELDELLDELLAMEELEQEFDGLFESFTEDIPVEDLPQEGDDEGFDHPEDWARPENPGGLESGPEPIGEGDDEDEADEGEADKGDGDEAEEAEEDDIYDLICGTYSVTEAVTTEYSDGDVDHQTYSLHLAVTRSGASMYIANTDGYDPLPMDFDPDTLTGTVNDAGTVLTLTFTISGDKVTLHGSGTDYEPDFYLDTFAIDGWKS